MAIDDPKAAFEQQYMQRMRRNLRSNLRCLEANLPYLKQRCHCRFLKKLLGGSQAFPSKKDYVRCGTCLSAKPST